METDTIDSGTPETDSAGKQPEGHNELARQESSEERGPALVHEDEHALAPAGEVNDFSPNAAEAEQEEVTAEDITAQQVTADDGTVEDDSVEDVTAEEVPAEDVPLEDAAPADADTTESPVVTALPLIAALESLLFVSDEAVEPAQLARALGLAPGEVEEGLQALDAAYRAGNRGLRLQTRNGRYQLVTAPEAANLIETFLNLDATSKLSAPALETLAVVAYRQPVTRAQIEAVRGVDCSGVLRSLLQRGLLEEVGRLDAPGRPVLYGVTDLFMHHFGLTALHELPPLESSELDRIDEAIEQQA